jgi:16S rRNA U516 pseudouridylate synthase RsuA-like enzyme
VVEIEGSEEESEGANRWYRIVVRGASGKDIRQLFERQGALVSRVQRIALGPLALTRDLNRGQFRVLSDEEATALATSAPAPKRVSAKRVSATPVRSSGGRTRGPRARRTRDR